MFLPSGNYLYAVGTDYYPRFIDGGSAVYDPYDRVGPDGGKDNKGPIEKDIKGDDAEIKKNETAKKDDAFPMRSMKITVTDEKNTPIKAAVEIKKWSRGKLVYSKRVPVDGPGREIQVPDSDDVEITADADGYMPKKKIISRSDDEASISLEKIEKGKGIVVDNIHFEIDEAYLKKESLNILDRMVDSLKRNPGIRLEVRGHTDSTGSREHNMKLSMRRADAVRDYMIKNGISPERLESKGFGFGKPIADNATAEGRRKNRRTEFFVLEK
jgi:outer membrane protein OmpA-like peptidoglycan-associated protein